VVRSNTLVVKNSTKKLQIK